MADIVYGFGRKEQLSLMISPFLLTVLQSILPPPPPPPLYSYVHPTLNPDTEAWRSFRLWIHACRTGTISFFFAVAVLIVLLMGVPVYGVWSTNSAGEPLKTVSTLVPSWR